MSQATSASDTSSMTHTRRPVKNMGQIGVMAMGNQGAFCPECAAFAAALRVLSADVLRLQTVIREYRERSTMGPSSYEWWTV
jgi:hypothetical protein